MSHMFLGATSFNGDISTWNVSNVTNMRAMFYEATSFNGDISTWDVSNVTGMGYMFYNATSFNGDIGNWDVSSVNNMVAMFTGITLTIATYDAILTSWGAQNLQNGVTFDAGNSVYCSKSAQLGRQNMTNTYGWTISDNGLASICTAISTGLSTIDFVKDYGNISLYPNPVMTHFKILSDLTIKSIKIFDLNGRLVIKYKDDESLTNKSIPTNSLNSGMYFITLDTEIGIITKKLLKN